MTDDNRSGKTKKSIIVIGGGASGLMAAGTAAQAGAAVTLLEKNSVTARKLSITGNRRCNITNMCPIKEFPSHYYYSSRFLKHALYSFSNYDVISFFENLSISFHEEDRGRVLPVNDNGRTISIAFQKWALDQGVRLLPDMKVRKLLLKQDHVIGVIAENSSQQRLSFHGDAVILATGGKSYPQTGSTGDGYRLAGTAGHSVISPKPALTGLIVKGSTAGKLQGISLPDVIVSLWIDNKKVMSRREAIIFTHYGLSGPVILNISRAAVEGVIDERETMLSIDLIPDLDHEQIDMQLKRHFNGHGNRRFRTILEYYLPGKMPFVCCEDLNIRAEKPSSQVSAKERKKLRLWLKSLTLTVSSFRSFEEAVVTAGGVDRAEVDHKTMESRIIKNLYFAGEVMDIDGETGGYNLQAAFSTGRLAGLSACGKGL